MASNRGEYAPVSSLSGLSLLGRSVNVEQECAREYVCGVCVYLYSGEYARKSMLSGGSRRECVCVERERERESMCMCVAGSTLECVD